MKRGPGFFYRDGKVVLLSVAERIANALAEVKAGLERKPVTDPKVWSGYPDGWRPGDEDDEDDPRVPVGLFLNLERCTRGNPTRQMAMAIGIAFELGRASIVGKADDAAAERVLADITAMANRRRKGGLKTGPAAKGDAEDRHRAIKEVWVARHDQFSDRKLAEKVCAGKFGRGLTDLSEERVRALFGEWAREEERNTCATGDWIASENGREHHRYTRDGYRVLLFEEDRNWRLLVEVPDVGEWRPVGSVESLDEAKVATYEYVDKLRKALVKRAAKMERHRRLARDAGTGPRRHRSASRPS
jgi:hypothetical protein